MKYFIQKYFKITFNFQLHGTMRKQDRLYTEDTYHGDAPLLDSAEAKELVEKDEDAKEAFISTKALLSSKSDQTARIINCTTLLTCIGYENSISSIDTFFFELVEMQTKGQ